MESESLQIIAKPFLKWAGGKGQLISKFRSHLPEKILRTKKIKKYFEPFIGGGAVFFWLAQEYKIEKVFLYDINPEIIMAYKSVQSKLNSLVDELLDIEKEYYSLDKKKQELNFYKKRDEYNSYISNSIPNNAVRRTALLIFLNKTCFNGLFRVNSKGLFNVPFGRYDHPTICDKVNLVAIQRVLKDAVIECGDFSKCLEGADSQSLVYFDPPYRPISKTSNFTGYIKGGFGEDEQKRLKEVFDELNRRNASVMLSNSDPKNINSEDNFFDELYSNYNRIRLDAKRMINSNASKRGSIKEILIMNYDVA